MEILDSYTGLYHDAVSRWLCTPGWDHSSLKAAVEYWQSILRELIGQHQGAWAAVSMLKLDAAARVAEVKAKEAEAKAEEAAIHAGDVPAPQITIDSDAELKTYAQILQTQAFARMAEQNGRVVDALANALNPPPRDTSLDIPEQPKHGVAQVIDSTGAAVTAVAQTPAAMAGTVGVVIGTAIKNTNPGTHIEGDMVASQVGSNSAGRDQLDASTQYGYTDRDIEQHEQTGTMDSVNDNRRIDNSVTDESQE